MLNNTEFILVLITFCINILTCLISFVILIFVIYHIFYDRLKPDDKVVVNLCAHIYFLIFFFVIIVISFNIQTILGDLYEKNFNSSWCILLGYLCPTLFGVLYWIFVNQAFFRLGCIVYSNYRYFQYSWIYLILFLIEFILVCILLCPILAWHDIVYLPKEYYCYVQFTNIRSMIWLMVMAYGIPLTLLLLIYVRITVFLRRQPNNQTMLVKQRQQRDLIVIRRIIIIVSILTSFGIPVIIFVIIFYITGQENSLQSRIVWLSASISMTELSLSLVILTPQLKQIILKKYQHNRVEANDGRGIAMISLKHTANTL